LSPTRLSISLNSQSWWLLASAPFVDRCAIVWSFP
jgi:hypothetical protein